MDELFRFVALRPPTTVYDEVVVDGSSPLAVRLAEARRVPNGRDAMNKAAQSFAQSGDFIDDASRLNLRLDELADALEGEEDGASSAADLTEHTLGASPHDIVRSPDFMADVARLQDTILAIKMGAAENAGAANALRLLGAADVVQRVASGEEFAGGSLSRFVRLPSAIFPLPPAAAIRPPDAGESDVPSDEEIQDDLRTRAGAIDDALAALSVLERTLVGTPTDAPRTRLFGHGTATEPGQTPTKPLRAGDPGPGRAVTLTLDHATISRLAPAVRSVLADLGIDPALMTLPSILHALRLELGKIEERLV